MRIAACTICARNYLAHARVFAHSFRHHHPGADVVALVLDDGDRLVGSDEPFEVLRPVDVLPGDEVARMSTAYGLVEFATSVKAALLEFLLASHDAVGYFDPDIQVFGPLDDVFRQAVSRGIVITPHSTDPLPTGGHGTSTEDIVLDAGVFNLGFIAVGRPAHAAVRWWDTKLRRECTIDPSRSRFVDQRWVDLFPAYFAPVIERDPGLNVAWWNLPTREIRDDGGHVVVNGSPLRFFHFSGYDPERPWMLTTHQGPIPRVLLSEDAALDRLTGAYRQALNDQGFARAQEAQYGLARSPEGLEIDDRMRRLYRSALARAEKAGTPEPPRLFDQPDARFIAWLATPDEPADGPWAVGRYLHAVWRETPELQERFPDPHRADAHALHAWAVSDGVREGAMPAALAAALTKPPPDAPSAFVDGVNLVVSGPESPAHGLIAADIADALGAHGIDVTMVALPAVSGTPSAGGGGRVPEMNIFVVPVHRLGTAMHYLTPSQAAAPFNVAVVWSPEPDARPNDHCTPLLDEVWVLDDVRADRLRAIPGMPPVEVITGRQAAAGSGTVLVIDCKGARGSNLARIAPDVPKDATVLAVGADHASEPLEFVRWLAATGTILSWRATDLTEARNEIAGAARVVQVGGGGDDPVPAPPDDAATESIVTARERIARRRRAGGSGARARFRLRGRA